MSLELSEMFEKADSATAMPGFKSMDFWPGSLVAFIYSLLFIFLPCQASAFAAGEVVFSVGPAKVFPRDIPSQRGLALFEGDVIVTEAGAHVHVRFADGALLSVRPHSRLSIERYQYEAQKPTEAAVKFRLESGTARSITGKAGEAAKDRFRLNTPVAAIGVRGTDFVVATDASSSAVAVNAGAVVVSPLGGGCAPEALGPCAGSLVKELSASMVGTLARVEGGKVELMGIRDLPPSRIAPPAQAEPKSVVTVPNQMPQVSAQNSTGVPLNTGLQTPTAAAQIAVVGVGIATPDANSGAIQVPAVTNQDSIHMSRSQELAAKVISSIAQTTELDAAKRVQSSDEIQRASVLASEEAQRASALVAEEAKRAALSPSVLSWGRWGQAVLPGDANPPQSLPQNPNFSTIVLSDGIYVLSGPQNARWSPAREGLYEYVLRDSKAYLRDAHGALSAGQISNGSLSIDLASASFQSRLTGTHPQVSGPIEVSAKGYLQDDGVFRSSLISEAAVTGVLVAQGREAAYVFKQNVNSLTGSSAEFAGLTRWGR